MATSEIKHVCDSAVDLLHIRTGNLNLIESHEKETKHIRASAADLLNTRKKKSRLVQMRALQNRSERNRLSLL